MKGLELSRGLFFEHALPLIERELPAVLPFLAAGLVGEGSECFGFDDELSRDHDWGPGFCIWLPADALEHYGTDLFSLLQHLPDEYGGVVVRMTHPAGRLGLMEIGNFYTRLIGFPDVPPTAEAWLSVPEPYLAAAVNGEVFTDNYGAFTRIRDQLLKGFPEDVRLRRMAQCAVLAGQTGQYNYLRCLQRGDAPAMVVIKGRFMENAAALAFLLNRQYRPYYKWTYRAMRQLPLLGESLFEHMSRLSTLPDGQAAVMEIEKISSLLITQLRMQGLSNSNSDFLMEHGGELLRRIEDPALRSRAISLVF